MSDALQITPMGAAWAGGHETLRQASHRTGDLGLGVLRLGLLRSHSFCRPVQAFDPSGVLVAANPEHAGGSLCVLGGGWLAALVAWPAGAWLRGCRRRGGSAVGAPAGRIGQRYRAAPRPGRVVRRGADRERQAGLAERVLGVAQAAWPLGPIDNDRDEPSIA